MAAKKNLGIGLDILLTATQGQHDATSDQSVLNQAQLLFTRALEQDEKGDTYEAYHLYRQVIDLLDTGVPEISELVSRACNNLAVILFESSKTEKAINYLQQAIDIYPRNRTALENMMLIRK